MKMKVMIANRSLSLYLIGNPFIFKIIFSFTDRQEIRVVIPVFLWAFQHVAIIPFLINWWPFNMLEAKERQHDSYFSRRSWTGEICLKMWSNVISITITSFSNKRFPDSSCWSSWQDLFGIHIRNFSSFSF